MLVEDVSTDEINPKAKDPAGRDRQQLVELGGYAINELQLRVDMKDRGDVEELSEVLVELLSYPNSDLAEVHADAMRLGNFDLEKPTLARNDTTASLAEQGQKNVMCPCCGFVRQTATISTCTSFDGIKNMGVSTYLYFSTYKKLAVLLAILTVLYSAFALATNYLASKSSSTSSLTSVDYIAISLSSKETNDTLDNRRYYFIQCWLGVATIGVWILALAVMKYSEVKSIEEYDNDTISCSDYSVVMEGMPLDVTKDELQKQLDQFYEGLNPDSIPAKWRKPFKVAKLNVGKPFYLNEEEFKDDEVANITKEIDQAKEKIVGLIIERQSSNSFSLPKPDRTALYTSLRTLNKRKAEKLQQMAATVKQSLKEQSGEEITTVFVTFDSNIARTYFQQLHEPSIIGRIRSLCGKTLDKFWYEKDGQYHRLEIRRAPEPEDIIWTNLGLRDCSGYCKKIFTFTATIVLLGVCFAIVFGLTRAQEDAGGSRLISIAISLTISIVNVMLGQIIRRLTAFERDYTETYRQASLAIKSVLAQMINTILIPIITAFYVKNRNLYYENGLVDNIFMLSISAIIVPPILLLVNPYRIFMAITRCCKSTAASKLRQSQKEHNILQEGVEFEVGYQSIYPTSVFMFVCFYVSLQPIISVIALIGYLLMYWVEKYSLFNRYRRPVPGMDFVNNAVFKMVSLGPIVYSFGSLTWANFSPNGIPPEAIIPNLIALAVSVVLFAMPFNSIILGACMGDNALKPSVFHDDRILMPSEYDRLNPSTQAEGFEDYKKYMERRKEEIKNLNKEQQEELAKKMMANAQRAQLMNQNRMQNAQMANPFQQNIPFFQPQPVMAYGQSPYAPTASYGGFAGYNPMASFAFSGIAPQMMMPAMVPAMLPPRPAIVNVPPPAPMPMPMQQMPVPRPPPQQPQGFNNYPQNNPMNSYSANNNPSQVGFNMQGGSNQNPFNQGGNPFGGNPMNQGGSTGFPPGNQVNNPAFNPFNSNNANGNGNGFNGGLNQGRRW